MGSKWPVKTLGQCATWLSGGTPRKSNPDYWNGSIPWISAKSLNNFFVEDSEDKVTEAAIGNGTRLVSKNTILFVVRGMSLKKEFRVGITVKPVSFNQDVKALIANDDVDPVFLVYAIRSKTSEILSLVEEAGHGTGVLPTPLIQSLEIEVPEISVQRIVSGFMRAMDEKIEINTQINQTLEHIAQAIFKSWFVDFEPTRAKIAAKQRWQALYDKIETSSPTCYVDQTDNAQNAPSLEETMTRAAMAAISGKPEEELDQLDPETQQQLKTTAALFPDALVDSELGEIPEGWVVGSIGDVAVAKGGYAFKGKSFVEEGNPVVKIKNITGNGSVDLSGAVCIDSEQAKLASRFKLNDGDLLMAMTGATVGKIGFVVTQGKSVYLNQRVAKFESEKFGRKVGWFLFCCFQRDSIFDSVVGAAHGSAQPNISSSGIEATSIVLPSDSLINVFCEKSHPLFSKWLSGVQENAYLEACRDELLPKLLSGELSIESN